MGKRVESKDKTYTIFDRAANFIRTYKPSAAVQTTLEGIAKATLKGLANAYLSKTLNKAKIKKEIKFFVKKTAKEIGKDLKTRVK